MSMFRRPKIASVATSPLPPPPPVTPLPDEGDEAVRRRMRNAAAALKNRQGRSSTLITGELGDSTPAPTTAAKTILGAG